MHGLYVRRIILKLGDPDHKILVAETFHEQSDDELTNKEVKQMEADDQAIQTIFIGLPEDIYDVIVRNQNGYNAVQNVRNQVVQNAIQNLGVLNVANQTRLIVVPGIDNQDANQNGNDNVVAAWAEGNSNGNNENQEEARIQLQAEEFDLMFVAGDLDRIEEVNENCILMANLQQASTSGTQTNKAPVYDSDGLAEFLGTVRFENDHIASILGYGKLQWGNILITRVYFVEGLWLHLLHMDLYGPMRVESINGKWYVLVIVDDYSHYTWVHFLRSKDEAPEEIKTFLKKIQVLLQAPVIIIRTDNGTKFKNQVLKEYFDDVGISHHTSSVKTPQQNGVVERRNQTLVEAAKTMLIFSCALLFLWDEVIATACYTQNHSIVHRQFGKTPHELINGRKPYISFLYVFGALCYPKTDEYTTKRKKKMMEKMNVTFDELSAMAFEQRSLKPEL
nr:hypothetical protein [Tanacetum cinerariifolium]